MKAAVVILNWNTRKYLEDFLPGLIESCRGLDSRVYVADSGSTDGSMDFVAGTEAVPLPLGGNFGFTGGYNRALSGLDAEYYVLINSDIEVPMGWLGPLLDHMDSHPDCGICGPKLLAWQDRSRFEYAGAAGGYADLFGYPYCRGRVLKRTAPDSGQYDSVKDVLWVSGACLMIRSSLWQTLGGLDESFFAHMEEIDLCWRAHFEGFRVTVVPSSQVWHIGGGTLAPQSPFKLKLNFRNSLMLLSKNLKPTFEGRGLSPCMAAFRARTIIAFRYLLDFGSLCVYLLTGHADFARSVHEAHAEFHRMKPSAVENKANNRVPGYTGRCILLLSFLKGDSIFKYLDKYENCN